MGKLFYFEMKNSKGEFEPLGVTTPREAARMSWTNGHAAIMSKRVRGINAAGTSTR